MAEDQKTDLQRARELYRQLFIAGRDDMQRLSDSLQVVEKSMEAHSKDPGRKEKSPGEPSSEEFFDALGEASSLIKQTLAMANEWTEVSIEGRVEGLKMHYETFKHQATLSSAAIVAIAAVSEGLLPASPKFKILLWAAYAALLFTVTGSVCAMRITTLVLENLLTTGSDSPIATRGILTMLMGNIRTESKSRIGIRLRLMWDKLSTKIAGITFRLINSVAPWTFPLGLGLFAVFAALNLL